MGRAEEAGDPQRPESPRIQHGQRPDGAIAPAASQSEAGDPPASVTADETAGTDEARPPVVMTGREMQRLEAELALALPIEEDFASAQQQMLADRVRQRTVERQLLEEMRAEGFDGPITQTWSAEMAAYALAVLMSWTRTGQIVKECKTRGRPIRLAELGPDRWDREDRLELVGETITRTLDYFVTKVLATDRWDARKGASLKTYFIGACLFQFPNVYDRWAREQRDWDRLCDLRIPVEETQAEAAPAAAQWDDPTSEQVLNRARRRYALELIADPVTRAAAEAILKGRSVKEAAQALNLKEKTLRTRLNRLKGIGTWNLAEEDAS